MPRYVIDPPPQASIAVSGSDERFPVRRIFCVGRNYAAHAIEMGGSDRDQPFFFSKPADAVVDSGSSLPYPPRTENFHHEIELVVAVGRGGANIPSDRVRDHLWGACVGIDLTRRDLQSAAREQGQPWDFSKGFDHSAPCSPLTPIDSLGTLEKGRIWLTVNGEMKQEADLEQLIWPVREHLAILSEFIALAPGDLIMTGTPAGVGPLQVGDEVKGGVDGLEDICIRIGDPL